MLAVNKWNGKEYEVLGESDGLTTLRRLSDRVEFAITKHEFEFSYRIIETGFKPK